MQTSNNTRLLGKPNIYALLTEVLPTHTEQFDSEVYTKLKRKNDGSAERYLSAFPKGMTAREIRKKMSSMGYGYAHFTINASLSAVSKREDYNILAGKPIKNEGKRGRGQSTYYYFTA